MPLFATRGGRAASVCFQFGETGPSLRPWNVPGLRVPHARRPCEGQRGPLWGRPEPRAMLPGTRVTPAPCPSSLGAVAAPQLATRGPAAPSSAAGRSLPSPSPFFTLNEQTRPVSPETFHPACPLAHRRRTKAHPGGIRAAEFSEGVGGGG